MTKTADVTNTDSVNTGKVTWAESHTGPYHTDTLNPGDVKSYTIATGTVLKIEGPASMSVKDTGTVSLSATQSLGTTIAPAASAGFTFPGPYDYVSVG